MGGNMTDVLPTADPAREWMQSLGFMRSEMPTPNGFYYTHKDLPYGTWIVDSAANFFYQQMLKILDSESKAVSAIFDWHAKMKHTLIIDRSSSSCGNCGRGCDPSERNHDTVYGYQHSGEPGCHYYYKYVTSNYMISGDGLKEMRPDLEVISPFPNMIQTLEVKEETK